MLVLYANNAEQLAEGAISRQAATLDPEGRRRLTAYRRWQDRQAMLLGRLLLRACATAVLGAAPDLRELAVDDYRRPYFPGLPDFDFNITHTDGLVACVAARGRGRVGIDVERVGEVDLREFRRVFTPEEFGYLEGLDDPRQEFYRLWTRKEAVMKADGRGFYLDPAGIDCRGDRVTIDGGDYAVRPLFLREGFAGHLAGAGGEGLEVREVDWEDLGTRVRAG